MRKRKKSWVKWRHFQVIKAGKRRDFASDVYIYIYIYGGGRVDVNPSFFFFFLLCHLKISVNFRHIEKLRVTVH